MSDRIAVVFLLAGAAAVRLAKPGESLLYPPCPFLWLTGLDCPGCGSLRALYAITEGDVAAAWSLNPLFMLFLLVFLIGGSARAMRARVLAPSWSYRLVPASIVAFWIGRNV